MNEKAGWHHYAVMGLAILGIWYVISKISHGRANKGDGPITDTAVDLSALVVFGGGA